MILEHGKEIESPEQNSIIVNNGGHIKHDNSHIVFNGKGNLLYVDGDVTLDNCWINFNGDNALLYLSGSNRAYRIHVDLYRDVTVFFGSDNYFNGPLKAIISERKNLIVGNEGLFSFGIWIRTADPHLIYSIETRKRINYSRSILIGDHVWVGQDAKILKGSKIGSGSIISASAVIAGKSVGSNSIWGGNPGRLIKEGIFFTGDSAHNFTRKQTKNSSSNDSNGYIYENKDVCSFNEIDKALRAAKDVNERTEILKDQLVNASKNRFYIKGQRNDSKGKSIIERLIIK